MKGLTTDSACEPIKGNKEEDRASTRKSSYTANFFFEAFFVKKVSNDGLAVAGMRCSQCFLILAAEDIRVILGYNNPGGSTTRIALFILPIPASSQGLLPAEESCNVTSRHGDQTDEADQAHWTSSSGELCRLRFRRWCRLYDNCYFLVLCTGFRCWFYAGRR